MRRRPNVFLASPVQRRRPNNDEEKSRTLKHTHTGSSRRRKSTNKYSTVQCVPTRGRMCYVRLRWRRPRPPHHVLVLSSASSWVETANNVSNMKWGRASHRFIAPPAPRLRGKTLPWKTCTMRRAATTGKADSRLNRGHARSYVVATRQTDWHTKMLNHAKHSSTVDRRRRRSMMTYRTYVVRATRAILPAMTTRQHVAVTQWSWPRTHYRGP